MGVAGFPADDYTPHGYLNLPGHTSVLRPLGVMRSRGAGYAWHFPGLQAGYGGRHQTYRAGLQVLGLGRLRASHHSSNVTVLHGLTGPTAEDEGAPPSAGGDAAEMRITWFMAGDDALCLRLESARSIEVDLLADYQRLVGAGTWSESGLVGRQESGHVILQSFESGEAFALGMLGEDPPAGFESEPTGAVTTTGAGVTALAQHGVQVELRARLRCPVQGGTPRWLVLARGTTKQSAARRLERLLSADTLAQVLAKHLAADDAFWSHAPRLHGDWPGHWRRGLVYDLETVRMLVKEPVGVHRHRWDAMQLQAPRTVLAEVAMDALILSRADPTTAAELLLGALQDAPAPNVPCIREDGSETMVAADGTSCGTGPQWGLPFVAVERLAALHPDPAWAEQIYPPMAAYLQWWLTHRRDSAGWLVHACSWESGQDLSPRFGPQPLGGGHPTWHIRPVDLHAAAAHAAGVLGRLARRVSPHDVSRWQAVEDEMSDQVHRLWHSTRFADHDAAKDEATDVEDVMLLLPLALGLTTPEETAQLQGAITDLDAGDLQWPMFAWTAVLAAQRAGRSEIAAALASGVIDRAWRHWDARQPADGGTLPGIACEFWPHHGRCGAEGYGWGAFGTELFLTVLLGLEVDDEGVWLRPTLPPALRVPGSRYGVALTVRGIRLTIDLRPCGRDNVTVDGFGQSGEAGPAQPIRRSWSQLGVRPTPPGCVPPPAL